MVQQYLLNAAGGAQELAAHRCGVEEFVQRVAGNVLDRFRYQKTLRYFTRRCFTRRSFIHCNCRGYVRHQPAEEHAAEDALIHEEQPLPGACPVGAHRTAGGSRSAGSSHRSQFERYAQVPRLLIKGRASLRLTARVAAGITARFIARFIAHEQLTAHAQMHHERLVGKRAVRLAQGQPQVLAAAVGTAQRPAGEYRLKVGGTGQVPA